MASDESSDSDTVKPSAGKRPADGKRTAVVLAVAAPDADTYEQKKQQQQLFQRLWSEDNEIELIQGMIHYVNLKAKDPLADVTDFHDFVKGSLHVEVNHRQLLTKARRLKKKFENNAAKVQSRGRVRSFSNPHESKMYELSKNLWRNESNSNDNNNNVVSPKKTKVKVNMTPRTTKGLGSMGWLVTDDVIINKGLELVSPAKKVELEAKWKNLRVQELEHFLRKVDVLKEQAEVVLDAIAKSGGK
ncbi:putative transcription factor At1g61730 [Bidens hawaiensis]|uniref:putative transcription factor At1g61730 n=1 Tax=Bidens hawaiensis TaxID=980011 RepID=UPI004049A0A3